MNRKSCIRWNERGYPLNFIASQLETVSRKAFSQWSVNSQTGIISFKNTPRYQTVIGLEIHAQLDIPTKLFSGCPIGADGKSLFQKPNSSVWPLDCAVPGVLPRLSQEAVRAAILSAAATKCEIPLVSRFERKHYFYADIPLGYQVTQQRWPIAREGFLTCRRTFGKPLSQTQKKRNNMSDENNGNETFTIGIERIQLEQDTGKTLVLTNPKTKRKESLVDFNRAGRALIELVFYPDLRSSLDASIAVETLKSLLKHIGTCDGKMEEGSLRCDLNVSIAPLVKDSVTNDNGGGNLFQRAGNRVEVKNLNSIRQIQQAAEYEAIRQAEAEAGGSPTRQETRTFDVKTGETVTIRSKEGAKDYRFMPEPDLPPLVLNEDFFGVPGMDLYTFLEANLPELPEDAKFRLQSEYGLSDYTANVLTGDPPSIELFDVAVNEAMKQVTDEREKRKVPDTVANLICNELFALVREFEMRQLIEDGLLEGSGETSVRFSKVSGMQLGEVVALVVEGSISNTMAKQLLRILYEKSKEVKDSAPRKVAKEYGIELITDSIELVKIVRDVIDNNPEEMERYKLGGKFKNKITKFLLGKAMASTLGNAHPERLNEVLAEVLNEIAPLPEDG
jgi:aspartyl-tRNA(Asn)/glutamyl-tRNA(Gln) amidotransferase subunit B